MIDLGRVFEPFPLENFWLPGGVAQDAVFLGSLQEGELEQDLTRGEFLSLEEEMEFLALFERFKRQLLMAGLKPAQRGQVDMSLRNVKAMVFPSEILDCVQLTQPHLVYAEGAAEVAGGRSGVMQRFKSSHLWLAEKGDFSGFMFSSGPSSPSYAFAMRCPLDLSAWFVGSVQA